MTRKVGLVCGALGLVLGACGGGSSSKGTPPPDETGGEGGGASTGGRGGQVTPKPDAALAADASSPEPDVGSMGTGGSVGGPEAGVPSPDLGGSPDVSGSTGEFPLAAVKAGKATLTGKVATQTEGPSYRDGSVYFASDGNGLVRMDETGKLWKYHPKLNPVGTYLLADGSLLVCEKAYTIVQVFKDGSVGSLFSAADHTKVDFCNDLTIDSKGDIYFTNPHKDEVWRLSVAGTLDKVVGLATGAFPNGLEVDRAGTSLYLSASNTLWKIALPGTGNAFGAPEKVGPGGADGMAFDAWDHLWLSIYSSGQLLIWDPATKQTIASISAGSNTGSTNVCFGDNAVYTTIADKGVYKIPIAGIRGFLHPGAGKYTIKQMLNLTPVNDPL
jgi:sugar lactone lactonase YvrE